MIAAVALALAVIALPDPVQETRAQALEKEIRCVQCENEPISQSTAPIALDMRQYVRERISVGDSDDEIRAFLADRYGQGVLLRPSFESSTWALWFAPVALAVFAIGVIFGRRNRRSADAEPLEPLESDR